MTAKDSTNVSESQGVTKGRRCAVTGASGYLGSRLTKALTKEGWIVYRLSRSANQETDPVTAPFPLDKGAPEGFFKDQRIDTLIHCAYDFRPITWSEIHEINVRGSVRLMEAAKAEGVKQMVFISTVSAFKDCKSLYGKAKLEIEHEALRLGAIVIRPGLIYGDEPGAMMGALDKAVKSSPIVPLIGNGNQLLYLVHEDDLVALIHRVAVGNNEKIGARIFAASTNGLSLRGILTALADRRKKRIRFVPVPWQLCWGILKALEGLGLRPGFRSDSIVSLVNTDPDLKSHLTSQKGLSFRDFSVGT